MSMTHRQRGRGLPRAFQHPQQRHIPPGRAAKHRASSESPRVTTATPVHNWVYRQQHAAGWRRFLSRLCPCVTHQPHSSSYALTGWRVLGQQRACTSRLEIPRLSRLLTQSRRNAPKMEPCWAWTHAEEPFLLLSRVASWEDHSGPFFNLFIETVHTISSLSQLNWNVNCSAKHVIKLKLNTAKYSSSTTV